MPKHVCGSCRFFDEAREGKQGWCTHPERRESSSVRILVRAAELRCRDDWGHDQWEPRTASDQVLGVVMNDSVAPRAPLADRRFIPVVDQPIADAPQPVQLSAAPLMPVADTREDREQADSTRTVSQDLNRELLRKAHAQARERQQNKTYSIAPERGNEPEPLVISNQFIPPSRDIQTPVSKGMTDSVFEFGGRGNEDAFDAVPDIDESRGAPRARPTSVRITRQAGPKIVEELSLPEPANDEVAGDIGSANVASVHAQRVAPGAEAWADEAVFSEPYEPRAETVEGNVDEAGIDDYRYADSDIDLNAWATARQVVKQPETNRLWADIPRCCMSCRDFRPAGNGERGWCTNQWAFKHRRMVDADDRPCETSIGHWWIPGDEAWQGEFDISALGQPTPLMDKWFGRSIGDETINAPAERRRRRTGSW